MCLGIPGKITEIAKEGPLRMGTVDFGGVRRQVCLDYVPEAKIGSYVLIHVGFAIGVLDDEDAAARLAAFQEIAEAAPRLNTDQGQS